MIGYASRTGTKRNLEQLRRHGWRILVSATGVWRCEGFLYCIDNGAWTAYQQGIPWEPEPFMELVETTGCEADFVIVPDIVGGGLESLELSKTWLEWLSTRVTLSLIPVQDGMTPDDVRPLLGSGRWVGIFVGGSTKWKWKTITKWGELAKEVDCYLHVRRVNTPRRIDAVAAAGAHSFDGTNLTRYASNADHISAMRDSAIDRAERQIGMFDEK